MPERSLAFKFNYLDKLVKLTVSSGYSRFPTLLMPKGKIFQHKRFPCEKGISEREGGYGVFGSVSRTVVPLN